MRHARTSLLVLAALATLAACTSTPSPVLPPDRAAFDEAPPPAPADTTARGGVPVTGG